MGRRGRRHRTSVRPRCAPPLNSPFWPLVRTSTGAGQEQSTSGTSWTLATECATIVAVSTAEPLRSVRDHLSEVVDRVEHQHERVIITRNGRHAAVVISPADLAALEETIAILSDPEALADIREADSAYASGDVIRGIDAVRRLAP